MPEQAPPPSKKLESWKEIAVYLRRSVRTVTRWADQYGLPVHRDAGGRSNRVHAFTAELDAWLAAGGGGMATVEATAPVEPLGEPSAGTDGTPVEAALDGQAPVSTRDTAGQPLLRRRWLLCSAAVFLVVLGLILLLRPIREGGQASFRLEIRGNKAAVWDGSGRAVWQRTFAGQILEDRTWEERIGGPMPARIHDLIDLEGDERPECLLILRLSPSRKVLVLLNEEGKERWRFVPEETYTLGEKTLGGDWGVRFFLWGDLDGDSHPEIAVVSNSAMSFAGQLVVLNRSGVRLETYYHSGHLQTAAITDLDGDGRLDVLAAGTNNGFRRLAVAWLQPGRLAGSSPQPGEPGYQLPALPRGPERRYVLLPRDCLSRVTMNFNSVQSLFVEPTRVMVGSVIYTGTTLGNSYVSYVLDRGLRLLAVEESFNYIAMHDHLFATGVLDHRFTRDEIDHLRSVWRWDGEQYVTDPPVKWDWQSPDAE